jgi:hypothetical protein
MITIHETEYYKPEDYSPSKEEWEHAIMPLWQVAVCTLLFAAMIGGIIGLGFEYDRFVQGANIISQQQ